MLTTQQKLRLLAGGQDFTIALLEGGIDMNDPETVFWLRSHLPPTNFQLALALCKCPCGSVITPDPPIPHVDPDPPIGEPCPVNIPAPLQWTGTAVQNGSPKPTSSDDGIDVQDDLVAGVPDRIKVAMAAGTPVLNKNWARWITATSGSETTFTWRVRDRLAILAPNCPRTVVGLEGRSGVKWSAWNDSRVQQLLLSEKMVSNPSTNNATAMQWSSKVLNGSGFNEVITRLFELTLLYRLTPLLTHFSIGPSQIWLGQSRLYADFMKEKGQPGVSVAHAPGTWDAIYAYYVKTDRAGLFKWISQYLRDPPPPPPSEGSAVPWLTSQTGNKDDAAAYYNGSGRFNGNSWISHYNQVGLQCVHVSHVSFRKLRVARWVMQPRLTHFAPSAISRALRLLRCIVARICRSWRRLVPIHSPIG